MCSAVFFARSGKRQAKPENRDCYRGSAAVIRAQAWRLAHVGYSRRKVAEGAAREPEHAELAMPVPGTDPGRLPSLRKTSGNAPSTPLQDVMDAQLIVLVVFVAHLLGSV